MSLYVCGQSLDRAYEEIMNALDVILKSIKPVNNTKKCKQAYKRRVQRAMYQVGVHDLPTSTPNLQIKSLSPLTNVTVLDVVCIPTAFQYPGQGPG
jgi:hypothetical protein